LFIAINLFGSANASINYHKKATNNACLGLGENLIEAFKSSSESFDVTPEVSALALLCKENNKTVFPESFNVNGHNQWGDTLLTQAAYWGNAERIKTLLVLGADINASATDRTGGMTPLTGAIRPSLKRISSVPSIILQILGKPVFAWNNKTNIVQMLCDAGADVNAQDSYGLTALDEANRCDCYPEIRAILLKAGAKTGTSRK
jgi:ankyrin repeat protein